MRTLLFIMTFFLVNTSFGQTKNDLREYGYLGQVKKITTYYYDTLSFDKNNRIYNRKLWRNKIVYFFDKYGNFDSILTYTQLPMFKDTIFITKTFYSYFQKSRFAVRTDGNNQVTDTVKYFWLTDTSYQTVETSVDKKQKVLSDLFLNKNFRDKRGKHTGYDEKDSIEYSEKYENVINQRGLLTRSLRTNLLENKTLVVGYQYFDFDKFENPTKIILTNLPDKKVFRIVSRTFEYY